MKKDKKKIIFLAVVLALVAALFVAAFIRTQIYNSAERQLNLEGDILYNIPDYSAIEVSFTKEAGGWSAEIDDVSYDAYTLVPEVCNPSDEDLSFYRVQVNVNADLYFITAWCGSIEFHQGVASGNEKVQTIDLRDRPDSYTVDTLALNEDEDPLIPLYAGDYFIYLPSTADGEAPLAAGASCAPGIMYYEPAGAEDVFEFVPYEAPAVSSDEQGEISAVLTVRSSTWTKVFDLENTGEDIPDHQAYTYDLVITNNSGATLSDYSFKFSFNTQAYLASAWNGSLEICQNGVTEFIEDLRNFDAASVSLDTINVDGEDFIALSGEDYFIYHPSSSQTASEIPVKTEESSVPGFIVYLVIGDGLNAPALQLDYTLLKSVTDDILFKLGIGIGLAFIILLIIFLITYLQRNRYEKLLEHDSKIIRESIETFTGFIDAKDPYTNGHSRRVAEYTKLLAGKMGYKEDDLERIYYVALLHDCGKIGIPDHILTKPGKLTDEEFEAIKSHTIKGRDILSNFSSIQDVTEGAVYHHERYDGRGYPEGKAGSEIPEIARIICVADSFDAMNSDRCYRKKLSREMIISEIENNKAKQFDPDIADVMLQLIRDNEIIV